MDGLKIPSVYGELLKKFMDGRIFTVKDILFSKLEPEKLYKDFLYLFLYPPNFSNFLNEVYS